MCDMIKRKQATAEKSKDNSESKHTENKHNESVSVGEPAVDEGSSADIAEGKTREASPETADEVSDKSVSDAVKINEKLAEMQDKYLRISAEFDNYRKRTLKEKMDMTRYAGENILSRLLPVIDDFERALKHMDIKADCTPLKEGVDLIYSKFLDFLKSQGVKEIESFGCVFNIDIHEAVAKVAVDDETKKGKVIDVVLKGYYLNDKVIRYAKVVVGE